MLGATRRDTGKKVALLLFGGQRRLLSQGSISNLRPAPCPRRPEFAEVTLGDVAAFADALSARDGGVASTERSLSRTGASDGRVHVLDPDLAALARRDARLRDHPCLFLGDDGDGGDGPTGDYVESRFAIDWLRQYAGRPPVALEPRSTAQVSRALAHCNERRIAVTPQAGNTGLSGACVPVHDEIVLSCGLMDAIGPIDTLGPVATCGSGAVLADLDAALAKVGLMAPLDLGAKGSCTIGGNLSTNAGGLRLLRYGSLHANVLGIEAVLADGRIVDLLRSPVRKDNTGYDLKQLFVGAEGTLGFITRAAILPAPKPASVNVALLSLARFEDLPRLLTLARESLGEILSAFEYMDSEAVHSYIAYNTCEVNGGSRAQLRIPDAARDPALPYHALVEVSGSDAGHDAEKLEAFLGAALESGIVADGTVAQDGEQLKSIWALREGISESCTRRGALYKYDLSVPVAEVHALAEDLRERLGVPSIVRDGPGRGAEEGGIACEVVTFGHLGDGNVHLNVTAPRQSPELVGALEPFVYQWAADRGGSVSAEHGIGLQKRGALASTKCPIALDVMRSVKDTLDPQGILNPYKLFLEDAERK